MIARRIVNCLFCVIAKKRIEQKTRPKIECIKGVLK
jgi:hypothetical protein